MHSNNVIKIETFKGVTQLSRNAYARIGRFSPQNMWQEVIQSTSKKSTHESTTTTLPHRTNAIKIENITELISLLMSLQIGQHVIIRECEDESIVLSTQEKIFLCTREVTFLTSKRRLAREDFRRQFLKGMPFQNTHSFKYLFSKKYHVDIFQDWSWRRAWESYWRHNV